jgi:hypothetical protein
VKTTTAYEPFGSSTGGGGGKVVVVVVDVAWGTIGGGGGVVADSTGPVVAGLHAPRETITARAAAVRLQVRRLRVSGLREAEFVEEGIARRLPS